MAKTFVIFAVIQHCVIFQEWICTARSVKTGKVFPTLLEQRNSEGELTLKINEDLVLNLQKASVFSDALQLSYFDGDSMLVHSVPAGVIEKDLYHDPQQGAAVMVSNSEGVQVEGMLGDRLRISPMSTAERNSAGYLAHQIDEVNMKHSGENDMAPSPLNERFAPINASEPSILSAMERARKEGTYTIRPEIHLLIDSVLASAFQKPSNISRYYAIFVAFLNLKFKTLEKWLDVQLVITKITTYSKGKDTFVQKPPGDVKFILTSTLSSLKDFIENKHEFKHDDIVILLTGLDIASYDSRSSRVHSQGTAGYAFVGGACRSAKVGIVEDDAYMFTGTHTFAHEVGHLLGMHHDGESEGTSHCKSTAGYIMAPSQNIDSLHMFSKCSSKQLLEFYNNPQTTCLSNTRTRAGKLLGAGKILKHAISPETFCKLKYPGKNIKHVESYEGDKEEYDIQYCDIICHDKDSRKLHFHDAPDNTLCYKGNLSLVCINKQCRAIPSDVKIHKIKKPTKVQ